MRFAICNLHASRVNLTMNDYAAGLPSPLAFLGLAESIGRDLGLENWMTEILPILHSVSVLDGRTKPEMEPKSGVFSATEIMEDLTGSVEFSLILDLPGFESASELGSLILCKRLAGGIITNNKKVSVHVVARDGSCLKSMRRGYAMVRPDEAERRLISSGNLLKMEQIARILFPESREKGSGWIIPVAVGHRLLENPDTVPTRIRVRVPDIPHVFVEPCVGIAELISVRNTRLTGLNDSSMSEYFWKWSSKGQYILAHPVYHPNQS
jgi:hypothetical protein